MKWDTHGLGNTHVVRYRSEAHTEWTGQAYGVGHTHGVGHTQGGAHIRSGTHMTWDTHRLERTQNGTLIE